MLSFYPFLVGEISDGSGELENACVTARGQAKAAGDLFQQHLSGRVELAEFADVTGLHLGVGVQAEFTQPLTLNLARPGDPLADVGTALGRFDLSQVFVRHARNLDVQVDTIEQRAGQLAAVALNHCRSTAAGVLLMRITQVAAGARIHCRNQHEVGRVGQTQRCPTDADLTIL